MSETWLHIITNDPARALLAALGCDESERPGWCAVIDDPVLIDRLPDGIRAVGLFYRGRYLSKAERAWRDRRAFGGIVGVSDADLAAIEAWIERRAVAERRMAFAHLPDRVDRPAPDEAPAVDTATGSVIARVPSDFRSMALSQRWV